MIWDGCWLCSSGQQRPGACVPPQDLPLVTCNWLNNGRHQHRPGAGCCVVAGGRSQVDKLIRGRLKAPPGSFRPGRRDDVRGAARGSIVNIDSIAGWLRAPIPGKLYTADQGRAIMIDAPPSYALRTGPRACCQRHCARAGTDGSPRVLLEDDEQKLDQILDASIRLGQTADDFAEIAHAAKTAASYLTGPTMGGGWRRLVRLEYGKP